jgi:predicted ABC-type ATPase
MNDRSAPTIHILAGPNGAGKTTFAKSYLPTFADCREFLNADLIASGLAPFAPETQAARASELLLQRIEELVADRASFSFETTLSARTYRPAIVKWRRWGYRITLHFFWLPTVEMAIQRVAKRVREGGHGIPESVIRRRYTRGLLNLFRSFPRASFMTVPKSLRCQSPRLTMQQCRSWTILNGRSFSGRHRRHVAMSSHPNDSLIAKVKLALEDAGRQAIERARAANSTLVIWRDGQIVELTPDEATRELEANLAARRAQTGR